MIDSTSQAYHAECILSHMVISNFTKRKSRFRVWVNANIGGMLALSLLVKPNDNGTDSLARMLEACSSELELIFTPKETANAMRAAWGEGKHVF
jgi:hypothetical protein